MLNLELLNLLYGRLECFFFKKGSLYLQLGNDRYDVYKAYQIELSNNIEEILAFFEYDTSIEYDSLSQKDLFVYLCSSAKLRNRYLNYYIEHFKGGSGYYPYTQEEKAFNKYIFQKYKKSEIDIQHDIDRWQTYAIQFFKKENEWNEYIKYNDLINTIDDKFNKLKVSLDIDYNMFERFLLYHGMHQVYTWSDNIIITKFKEFQLCNSSGLRAFFRYRGWRHT